MRSFFPQSIQQQLSVTKSSLLVLRKNASIRSKLPTAACWSREEKRGKCEANMLYVKSDCGTTDKTFTESLQYSSRVEALNLIVESKSLLVKLNNSTIELQVPSKRKKSLQSYCSVDFDFLAFDMTLDVTSRNGSSFSKHTNSCY